MTFRPAGAVPAPHPTGEPKAAPHKGFKPSVDAREAAAPRDQVTLSSAGRTLAHALAAREAGGYAAPGELILSPARLRELVRPERARNLLNADARGVAPEELTRHAAAILQDLQGPQGTEDARGTPEEDAALKSGTPPADTGSNQPNTEDDHGH
jgi:hypothetical protein